jgi:cytochrome b pre-mRNA-processing protein 3
MIFPSFRLWRRNPSIAALYGAIVAQARSPAFYRDYGVPDTLEGRFELIVLHTMLVVRRLAGGDADMRKLGQAVFDQFCRDMDQNLRELGVGDLAVPRHMQRMGEAYYGRTAAYAAALDPGDRDRLAGALAKNIFSTMGDPPAGARRLAAYVAEAVRTLARQDPGGSDRPLLRFPDAASVSDAEPS